MKKSGIVTPFGGEYESTQTPVTPQAVAMVAPDEPFDLFEAVARCWEAPAGNIIVIRDRAERHKTGDVIAKRVEGSDGVILAPEERGELMEAFEIWATVLLVGPPKVTDSGAIIHPPNVVPGQRVAIHATAAADMDVPLDNGVVCRITKIGFNGLALIGRMPPDAGVPMQG